MIFRKAKGILFIKGRIRFYVPDGKEGGTPECGNVLVAFGKQNAENLRYCGIPGKYFAIGNL